MIQLTRLNNTCLFVNSDLIKFVEQSPDTVITLINGEKIVVRESADTVMQRMLQFQCSVLQGAYPSAAHFSLIRAEGAETSPSEQAER